MLPWSYKSELMLFFHNTVSSSHLSFSWIYFTWLCAVCLHMPHFPFFLPTALKKSQINDNNPDKEKMSKYNMSNIKMNKSSADKKTQTQTESGQKYSFCPWEREREKSPLLLLLFLLLKAFSWCGRLQTWVEGWRCQWSLKPWETRLWFCVV